MSLRSRLLIGLVAIFVAFGVAAWFVISSQQRYLLRQVDRQLGLVTDGTVGSLNVRPRPGNGTGADGRPSRPGRPDNESDIVSDIEDAPEDSPFSEIYAARLTPAGVLRPIITSGLLSDTPRISLADIRARASNSERVLITVRGVSSSNRFRVAVVPRQNGSWVIVALPLTRTEAAINRLLVAFGIAALVLLAMSALVAWWFVRLGLRPIKEMTLAADAVTAGERGQRVGFDDTRTETGRLGHAFNVMLDERQGAEDRLRRFVADASHELRTPITSIRGYVDLYQQGGLSESDRLDDAMRRVGQEAGRMGTLVEDLLLLANLDQKRPLAQEPVDLGQVLNDAAADALAMQPTRSVLLDAPAPGELVVTGDDHRLRQVVGVLVHNALVHTPGSAGIALSARRIGSSATVEVLDHGDGMTADEAGHAFERFYRGDPSRSRHRGGSGLGLSIAKSIVEAHHGTITLDTSPGAGCRFTITLPLA